MNARIRRVFPRDEVAHLWAHKAQDGARDAGGNFFFTGATLYSYGRHYVIAHILADECGPSLAGRVLWKHRAAQACRLNTHAGLPACTPAPCAVAVNRGRTAPARW